MVDIDKVKMDPTIGLIWRSFEFKHFCLICQSVAKLAVSAERKYFVKAPFMHVYKCDSNMF